METKGKRILRIAGPGEPPSMPAGAPLGTPVGNTETPRQISPDAAAETGIATALAALDAVAETSPAAPAALDVAAEASPAAAPSPSDAVGQRVFSTMPPAAAASAKLGDFGHEAFAALEESRAALAHGIEALSGELAGLARGGVDMAARTAIEMLAVRTVSDAIAVNAGFARASFDNWLGSSARFSELGARFAAESSRAFFDRLGRAWIGAGRTGH